MNSQTVAIIKLIKQKLERIQTNKDEDNIIDLTNEQFYYCKHNNIFFDIYNELGSIAVFQDFKIRTKKLEKQPDAIHTL